MNNTDVIGIKMSIKSFEFSNIEGKRFSKLNEKIMNIKIDHNSTITLISVASQNDVLIDFRFTTTFGGVGVVTIEGHIVWGDCEANAVSKSWSTTSQIPNEMAQEVHSAILANCLSEVVMLSRDLRLPPPIPIPAINPKDAKGIKPSSGVEVA